ncbi:hypothetical protein ACWGJX_46645 [Streptomyces sp. NPDC054775]
MDINDAISSWLTNVIKQLGNPEELEVHAAELRMQANHVRTLHAQLASYVGDGEWSGPSASEFSYSWYQHLILATQTAESLETTAAKVVDHANRAWKIVKEVIGIALEIIEILAVGLILTSLLAGVSDIIWARLAPLIQRILQLLEEFSQMLTRFTDTMREIGSAAGHVGKKAGEIFGKGITSLVESAPANARSYVGFYIAEAAPKLMSGRTVDWRGNAWQTAAFFGVDIGHNLLEEGLEATKYGKRLKEAVEGKQLTVEGRASDLSEITNEGVRSGHVIAKPVSPGAVPHAELAVTPSGPLPVAGKGVAQPTVRQEIPTAGHIDQILSPRQPSQAVDTQIQRAPEAVEKLSQLKKSDPTAASSSPAEPRQVSSPRTTSTTGGGVQAADTPMHESAALPGTPSAGGGSFSSQVDGIAPVPGLVHNSPKLGPTAETKLRGELSGRIPNSEASGSEALSAALADGTHVSPPRQGLPAPQSLPARRSNQQPGIPGLPDAVRRDLSSATPSLPQRIVPGRGEHTPPEAVPRHQDMTSREPMIPLADRLSAELHRGGPAVSKSESFHDQSFARRTEDHERGSHQEVSRGVDTTRPRTASNTDSAAPAFTKSRTDGSSEISNAGFGPVRTSREELSNQAPNPSTVFSPSPSDALPHAHITQSQADVAPSVRLSDESSSSPRKSGTEEVQQDAVTSTSTKYSARITGDFTPSVHRPFEPKTGRESLYAGMKEGFNIVIGNMEMDGIVSHVTGRKTQPDDFAFEVVGGVLGGTRQGLFHYLPVGERWGYHRQPENSPSILRYLAGTPLSWSYYGMYMTSKEAIMNALHGHTTPTQIDP